MHFQGSMVALVTPMCSDESIDFDALNKLIDWHLAAKTDAIIVTGTTGESATLTAEEQAEVIAHVVKHIHGRIPVIAGTGTNATKSSIERSKHAKTLGADACLIVTPYYNKPTQTGLIAHYQAIAEQVDLPIILYNVPGRTACDMLADTVYELSKIKNIIGIKEATGKLERAQEIIQRCGQHFDVYSGDDATALSLMQHGARGVISVTANVAPELMHQMCHFALSGNYGKADEINQKLNHLHHDLFLEANPIPVKWALHHLNKIQNYLRLPLLPLSPEYHHQIKKAIALAQEQQPA